jgi:hypothetical protein
MVYSLTSSLFFLLHIRFLPNSVVVNSPPSPLKILQSKLALYSSWTAGNDIDTQRKGIVVLVWYDKSFKVPLKPPTNKYKLHEVLTVRVCALHCCTPDTPFHRFRRAAMTMKASHVRLKLRVHVGTLRLRCVTFVLVLRSCVQNNMIRYVPFLFRWLTVFFLAHFPPSARKHGRTQLHPSGLRTPHRYHPYHVFRDGEETIDAAVDAVAGLFGGTSLPKHRGDPIDHRMSV